MGEAEVMGRTREAWSEFGEEFADIGRRFKESYDGISETAEETTEASRDSIERAVRAIRKAVGDLGDSLGEALSDPKVRQETEEAGSKLLNAFGVTLSDLGQALQRDAKQSDTGSS